MITRKTYLRRNEFRALVQGGRSEQQPGNQPGHAAVVEASVVLQARELQDSAHRRESEPSLSRKREAARVGLLRRTKRPHAPVVLVYHHIAEKPCQFSDLLGVTTQPEVFRRHLRHAARNFDLISPDDLLSSRLPKRPLLVTFDDAYRSVHDLAGPMLREFGAPSIFFLNPGVITSETLPLDNLLCFAMHALGPAELSRIMRVQVRGMADAVLHGACRLGVEGAAAVRAQLYHRLAKSEAALRQECGLFLDRRQTAQLTDYGIEAGNHSFSHPFLRGLNEEGLRLEIEHSKVVIEQLTGRRVRWFSVPYGDTLDATPAVLRSARDSGHGAVFLVQGRPNRHRPAADVFFRVGPRNIPAPLLGLSTGILPELRNLRRRAHLPTAV